MFFVEPMQLKDFWEHTRIRGIYEKLSPSTRKRDIYNLAKHEFVVFLQKEESDGKEIREISVNWNLLRVLRLRLDVAAHRPTIQ
jgi:hypothetical protein